MAHTSYHKSAQGLLLSLARMSECPHVAPMRMSAVQAGQLPAKLNAVVQPLMAALRREPEPALRAVAAEALAELAAQCGARQPSPNERCVGL